MAFKTQIKGNFFVVTDTLTNDQYIRLNQANLVYSRDSDDNFVFIDATKNEELGIQIAASALRYVKEVRTVFAFANLVDVNGDAFASADAFEDWLSTNTGNIYSSLAVQNNPFLPFTFIPSFYYDNSINGSTGTLAGAANRCDLSFYTPPATFTVNQIGCAVTTGVAASLFKIVIYELAANGLSGSLVYEGANLSGAATGFIFNVAAFTFTKGKSYLLGVRHSSTCTLRSIAVLESPSFGLGNNGANTTYATIFRRTITFADPAPSIWTISGAELTLNVTPPSIRFRVA